MHINRVSGSTLNAKTAISTIVSVLVGVLVQVFVPKILKSISVLIEIHIVSAFVVFCPN